MKKFYKVLLTLMLSFMGVVDSVNAAGVSSENWENLSSLISSDDSNLYSFEFTYENGKCRFCINISDPSAMKNGEQIKIKLPGGIHYGEPRNAKVYLNGKMIGTLYIGSGSSYALFTVTDFSVGDITSSSGHLELDVIFDDSSDSVSSESDTPVISSSSSVVDANSSLIGSSSSVLELSNVSSNMITSSSYSSLSMSHSNNGSISSKSSPVIDPSYLISVDPSNQASSSFVIDASSSSYSDVLILPSSSSSMTEPDYSISVSSSEWMPGMNGSSSKKTSSVHSSSKVSANGSQIHSASINASSTDSSAKSSHTNSSQTLVTSSKQSSTTISRSSSKKTSSTHSTSHVASMSNQNHSVSSVVNVGSASSVESSKVDSSSSVSSSQIDSQASSVASSHLSSEKPSVVVSSSVNSDENADSQVIVVASTSEVPANKQSQSFSVISNNQDQNVVLEKQNSTNQPNSMVGTSATQQTDSVDELDSLLATASKVASNKEKMNSTFNENLVQLVANGKQLTSAQLSELENQSNSLASRIQQAINKAKGHRSKRNFLDLPIKGVLPNTHLDPYTWVYSLIGLVIVYLSGKKLFKRK